MKNKKLLLIIGIILFILLSFAGCGSDSDKTNNSTENIISNNNFESNNNVITNNENEEENNLSSISNTEVKSNTSQKVDEIARKAKQDAKNITSEKQKEAIQYIKNNKSNFFKNNDVMEKSMYYGYLLEYAYKDSKKEYAKLGQDVYQAIKYVYRGAEKVEDSSTQENLRQIEKDLKQIK